MRWFAPCSLWHSLVHVALQASFANQNWLIPNKRSSWVSWIPPQVSSLQIVRLDCFSRTLMLLNKNNLPANQRNSNRQLAVSEQSQSPSRCGQLQTAQPTIGKPWLSHCIAWMFRGLKGTDHVFVGISQGDTPARI